MNESKNCMKWRENDMSMKFILPEEIKAYIGNQTYRQDDIGMSDSVVLMFSDYVVKIQPHTAEADNQAAVVKWLAGRLPVPQIPVYLVRDHVSYTLMTRVDGEMLCDEAFLRDPRHMLHLAAEAMKMLWSVDVSDCPRGVSPLEMRLHEARYRVEHGMVDMDHVEPETFGADGFADEWELLEWLENHRPQEDVVLTHGDFCLPNILVKDDRVAGFIDLGKMGPADRWQDVAIALRSLRHNFEGDYNGGEKYSDFDPQLFLDGLGIKMDEEKNRYYMLLDELF